MRYRRQAHCLWDTPLGTIPTFNSPMPAGRPMCRILALNIQTVQRIPVARLSSGVLPRFTDSLRFLIMYRGLCCPDSFFDCWPVSFQQRRFVDFVPFVCPSGVCCLAQTRRSTYVTILFESLATRPHPADLHSDQLRMSEIVQRTIPPKNSGP
jgi:hypothetical protein